MTISLDEICKVLSREGYAIKISGDTSRFIEDFCPLTKLRDNCLTWIKKIQGFDQSRIEAFSNLVVFTNDSPDFEIPDSITFIIAQDPKAAYFECLNTFFLAKELPEVSETATVLSQKVGNNVSIGAHTFIGEEVTIGDNTVIRRNVVIENRVTLGKNCVVNSGTIIGSSGYGYYTTPQGKSKKVPDFGGVFIGDNVEIGANVCIDRGTLDDTIIENGVKIDNLCHIGHNTHIGEESFVVALCAIGGSAVLKEHVYVAPGALIINQATIGANAMVGLGAVVTKDVEPNKVVVGVPAKVIRDNN